jgi:DNA polymerase I-like protein with 3'-5' exonuclease and polymerase domains
MQQLPLFQPKAAWTPPSLGDLPQWKGIRRLGFDLETRDTYLDVLGPGVRRGAEVVGFSLAVEDGPKFYVPLRHPDTDNCDEAQAWQYLRDNAAAFSGELVGANLSYELDFLWHNGVKFGQGTRFLDVQIAEPLIDELQLSYSLEAISRKYLGRGKAEDKLREAAAAYGVDPKKGLWQLPARYVGQYGEEDADLPLKILRRQERVLDEQDLWQVFNLETDVLPVLVKMRQRGLRIDQDHLNYVEQYCIERQLAQLDIVRRETGLTIGRQHLMNAQVLAQAFMQQGLKVPLTAKTRKPSVGKPQFAQYKGNKVVDAIAEARRYHKIANDFVGSIRRHMINGRIHGSFTQLRRNKEEDDSFDADGDPEDQEGGRYGRLASCDPNMQQQPARDPELGPLWRKIYLPDEGGQWGSFDYSQQEPRMAVHCAVLAGGAIEQETGRPFISSYAWSRAKAAAKKYTDDPSTDNHQMMADMAGISRKAAKEIFLGLCYGMGGPKLCGKLGLPTKVIPHWKDPDRLVEVAGDEGDALIKKFDAEVPFIRETAKALERVAKRRGYITTLLGRRCRFPVDNLGNFDWTHKAFNRYVQGSSADQTKKAVVELDRADMYLQLQVHDETDGTIESHAQAEQWAQIMIDCVPLSLPSKVDIEIGPSWGEAK